MELKFVRCLNTDRVGTNTDYEHYTYLLSVDEIATVEDNCATDKHGRDHLMCDEHGVFSSEFDEVIVTIEV